MGFKGFNPGMICRGKQYSEHTLFEERDVIPCESGLHFCESPIEVLYHYPLINADGELNEFATVFSCRKPFNIDGKKFCTSELYVDKKLTLKELVAEAFKFNTRDAPRRVGDRAWISSSAYAAQMTSVTNCAHIATAANYSCIFASGRFDHIAVGGDNCSVLSVGAETSIASSGECSQIVTEGKNVSIVASGKYTRVYQKGDNSRISCTGDGCVIISKGKNAIISASGRDSIVKGRIGSLVTFLEWEFSYKEDEFVPTLPKTVVIDGKIIKENIFYTLRRGQFVEWERENNDSR